MAERILEYIPPERSVDFIVGQLSGYSREQNIDRFYDLKERLIVGENPPSLESVVVSLREFLGVDRPNTTPLTEAQFPQARALLAYMVDKTPMQPLIPETLLELGFSEELIRENMNWEETLDMLVIGGRHIDGQREVEPQLYGIVNEAKARNMSVGMARYVEQFGDRQPQTLGFEDLLHTVDTLTIVASTQSLGAERELRNTLEALSDPKILKKVNSIHIFMPMIGASRNDKRAHNFGREVPSAQSDALWYSSYIKTYLVDNGFPLDHITVVTYDIHGSDHPATVYEKEGIRFVSITPEYLFASELIANLVQREEYGINGVDLPLKIDVYDDGAVKRSQRFAEAILRHPDSMWQTIDLVYIKKTRVVAGKVQDAEVKKIERWTLCANGDIEIYELAEDGDEGFRAPSKSRPCQEACIFAALDDINDKGGTSERNHQAVHLVYPNTTFEIAMFAHLVASGGVTMSVKRTGAVYIMVGDTLTSPTSPNVKNEPGLRVVGLASAYIDQLVA